MRATAPAVTVRGLACRYRSSRADVVADLELELEPGELLLVAGGSASGKSTLLRCLNGLVPRGYRGSRLMGQLAVGGVDLARLDLAQIGTRVGTLLQDPARQVVGFDVRREVAFGPENLGLAPDEVERRVAAAAERLGIEGLLDRETATLSGGELQKVALAGVLAMEPAVLLFDEPLAALDPASARDVARLLRELADEGRAVVVVEHRVEELCAARPDRALVLVGGRPGYLGDFAGFLAQADPRSASLPADVAVARWRALGPDAARAFPAVVRSPDPPAGAPPLVELEGVRFAYGEREVLRGVDLCVRENEVLALLGANGSGKSTLLKVVAGLRRPSAGTLRLAGRDAAATTAAERARTVGYVFQEPASMLFADSVEQECRFAPENLGLDRVDARVAAALERLGLEALRTEAPGRLSLGQQKRVAIAAVAGVEPAVWLLDEPTAGMDPGGVADVLAGLRASGGRTCLVATHDVDLALALASRIALLDEGRVLACGTPAEVLTRPELVARARLRPTSLLERNRERLEAGLPPRTAREWAAEPDPGGERASP